MRVFKAEDGKRWTARLHERDGTTTVISEDRAGWEIIQFDSDPPGQIQRITYRPSGWLAIASIQELIAALRESDTVRASWRRGD